MRHRLAKMLHVEEAVNGVTAQIEEHGVRHGRIVPFLRLVVGVQAVDLERPARRVVARSPGRHWPDITGRAVNRDRHPLAALVDIHQDCGLRCRGKRNRQRRADERAEMPRSNTRTQTQRRADTHVTPTIGAKADDAHPNLTNLPQAFRSNQELANARPERLVNEAGKSLGEMRPNWLGPVTFPKCGSRNSGCSGSLSRALRRVERSCAQRCAAEPGPFQPRGWRDAVTWILMPLEILHRALVPLRGGARTESAEIAAPPGLRILLARIEPVFARAKLADHDGSLAVPSSFKQRHGSAFRSSARKVKRMGWAMPSLERWSFA